MRPDAPAMALGAEPAGATIRFFVAGRPKAMQHGAMKSWRNRAGQIEHAPIRRHGEWAALVGLVGRQVAPRRPLAGPLRVTVTFSLPRPARPPSPAPVTRPDLDNLLHKLTDQFNGVFWHDDSQIVELIASKDYADDAGARPCGVHITVTPKGEESA